MSHLLCSADGVSLRYYKPFWLARSTSLLFISDFSKRVSSSACVCCGSFWTIIHTFSSSKSNVFVFKGARHSSFQQRQCMISPLSLFFWYLKILSKSEPFRRYFQKCSHFSEENNFLGGTRVLWELLIPLKGIAICQSWQNFRFQLMQGTEVDTCQ